MNTSEFLQRARDFLRGRQKSYQRTFNPANRDANAVLVDLAQFCRAHESTFHPDDRAAARLDGRREVWLRMQHHLQLSDEALWRLYHQAKGE